MAAPAPDFDSLDWKKFTGGNLDLVKELALEEEEVGGWTFVVEAKAVRVVKKQVEDRPTSIIRGKGVISAPAREVYAYLKQIDKRKEWDSMFDGANIVKELEKDQAGLLHFKTVGQGWTVWPRDFCMLVASSEDEDGSFRIAAKSVASSLIPPTSGFVRANCIISGMLIRPLDDNSCELIYLFEIDVGGWLPVSVVTMVNEKQPLSIISIRRNVTGCPDEPCTHPK